MQPSNEPNAIELALSRLEDLELELESDRRPLPMQLFRQVAREIGIMDDEGLKESGY